MGVTILGATGETGRSVANALLDDSEQFELTALIHPPSLDKEVATLKSRGVRIVSIDLATAPHREIVDLLRGTDVVISCVLAHVMTEQLALTTAAKEAGVQRLVPSFFGPVMPARGVQTLREQKEDLLDHVKRLCLPYTALDIGWWYQLILPHLPSGRIDGSLAVRSEAMVGDGRTPLALTDMRDVGRFVVPVIAPADAEQKRLCARRGADPGASGGGLRGGNPLKIREFLAIHTSGEEISATINQAKEKMAQGTTDFATQLQLFGGQYQYSWGIRGDNTLEHAKYLGYLDAKELYPDLKPRKFKDYVQAVVDGTAPKVWEASQDWGS
ncbi:uncharacterized protein E0L32_000602 [Thyridium curvatum]|uniref:NmrA-like domain-containing protein n=1 Tax=Thyridium curvatum TaxID=1093900 RepID=A0A507BBI7_9PEZI|nr:uncharacterized protein E0L32_000602 [Thyridium curvatum]TPX14208.1 hypothetical protein E0L32_000602 [Thyridium curvatum]